MMGAMLPTYERLVSMKVVGLARNSAEAGLDYTVGQLNVALQAGQTSSLDASLINTSRTTILPSNLTGATGATVSVTVFNETPPTTAIMYDPNITSLVAQGIIPSNPFRRVEATATIAGIKKTIRIIVAPTISSPPYFPFAAFGKSSLNSVGPATTDSYNLPANDPANSALYKNSNGFYNLYANLGTNGTMVHNGDTVHPVAIGGSLFQFPAPNANSAAQTAARNSIMSQFSHTPPAQYQFPWLQIYDNVYSNTDTSGYWPRGQYPQQMNSWNNVYGWSNPGIPDPNNLGQPGPNGVVSPYATYRGATVQPAPSSPTGTYNLGSVRITNSAQLVFQDNAPAPSAQVGTLSSGTVTLPPGSYIMNGLTMTNTANMTNKSSSPVTIYIEGVSSGASTAISIGSKTTVNMDSNSRASGMNIYYNGSKTVNLYGEQKSIVYAPNAAVTIGSGTAAGSDFYGSVVGDSINLNGGHKTNGGANLHFDASLRQGDLFGTNSMQVGNQVTISGLKAVSWQEL
jgi:hypothetical protein